MKKQKQKKIMSWKKLPNTTNRISLFFIFFYFVWQLTFFSAGVRIPLKGANCRNHDLADRKSFDLLQKGNTSEVGRVLHLKTADRLSYAFFFFSFFFSLFLSFFLSVFCNSNVLKYLLFTWLYFFFFLGSRELYNKFLY